MRNDRARGLLCDLLSARMISPELDPKPPSTLSALFEETSLQNPFPRLSEHLLICYHAGLNVYPPPQECDWARSRSAGRAERAEQQHSAPNCGRVQLRRDQRVPSERTVCDRIFEVSWNESWSD